MKVKYTLMITILAALFFPFSATCQDKLLIIAPDDFIDELKPLKRFKDGTVRPTILLSLNDVYKSFNGVDEPEQIKRCIAYYEDEHSVSFVMLVGDVDKFPVRWTWWGYVGKNPDGTLAYNTKDDQRGWAVSDLYYADLYKNGTTTFDDWDSNNNGLYGEIEFEADPIDCFFDCRTINNDTIDFLPDVSVGRIPASTEVEVTAYVNKVIAYETATTPSETWFKTVGLYTGCWISTAGDTKDEIGTSLKDKGFTLLPSSESQRLRYGNWHQCVPPSAKPCCDPPLHMPDTVVNDFENGLGFANFLGHGNIWGWACLGFGTAQLNNLNNAGKLPIAFGGACDTGMFARLARGDHYIDTNNVAHCAGEDIVVSYPYSSLANPNPIQQGTISCNGTVSELDMNCFAENLLFGFGNAKDATPSSNGAIAYLGARSGGQWGMPFLDKFFFQAYTNGNEILGDMWKEMVESYYWDRKLDQAHTIVTRDDWRAGHGFDEPQKLILFGDPSLMVGGAFKINRCGTIYDGEFTGGPLSGYSRYRLDCDITVPPGEKLTIYPHASVLFANGKKITAEATGLDEGLVVNGGSGMPITFLSLAPEPQSDHAIQGMMLTGQLRMRNGGQIKLY